jgi:hypothetical protein
VGLATLAAVASVVLVSLYGVQWPRALWRRRWARAAPAWVGFAWAPALVVAVLLAAAVPPSTPATVILLALGAVLGLWSIAVGEPDLRQPGQPVPQFRWRGPIISFPIAMVVYVLYWGLLRPGVRFSWQLRSVFTFFYLAVFWLVASDDLTGAAAAQMTGPLLAAAMGFSVGAGTLAAVWARLAARDRRVWLLGLAGLIVAALAALWLARDIAAARPVAAALVAAAVFAHKAPASNLGGAASTARDLVMRLGWLVLVWVAANVADLATNWVAGLVILAIAVLVALIVAVERTGQAHGGGIRERMARFGWAAVRYGWLALAPVLLVVLAGPGTISLLTVGLWLLGGVGATLAGHAPSFRSSGGPRRA